MHFKFSRDIDSSKNSKISSSDLYRFQQPLKKAIVDNDGPIFSTSFRTHAIDGSQPRTREHDPLYLSIVVMSLSETLTDPSRSLAAKTDRLVIDSRSIARNLIINCSKSLSQTDILSVVKFFRFRDIIDSNRSIGIPSPTVSRTVKGQTVATKLHHRLTVETLIVSDRVKNSSILLKHGSSDIIIAMKEINAPTQKKVGF
jgi:hypothetical protein